MSRAAVVAAVLAALTLASCAANRAESRFQEASALACARASVADFESEYAGTDQAIADCYTSRGLPLPEGI